MKIDGYVGQVFSPDIKPAYDDLETQRFLRSRTTMSTLEIS
jgi:hypothetical protein